MLPYMARTPPVGGSNRVNGETGPNIRPYGRLDEITLQRYLHEVSRTGQLVASAYRVGVSYDSTLRARENPDYQKAVNEALDRYRDVIDAEIRRRGIEGSQEPVFYQGRIVGWVLKFSDALLIAHAKAHDPRYRDRSEIDVTHKGGVMAVPLTPSAPDWERRFSEPAPS